jgi:flagellar protein FliO/FliZ
MRTSSPLRPLGLLMFFLLMSLCSQAALAQYKNGFATHRRIARAQTNLATTSAAQTNNVPAQTTATPEASPAPATDHPVNTQPTKESEPLPFTLDEKSEANAESPSAAGLLMKTLGALLLIVGLIVAAGWGLRRFGGTRFGATRKDAPELSVLTSVSLGNRRSIAVVRFGTRNLLIGSTAQAISLLDAEDSEIVETKIPVARSVADLLKAGDSEEFQGVLAEAGAKLNDISPEWREEEGGAA